MRTMIDSLVKRLTVYRLTLYSLLALATYTLGLAFVGALDFNPLTMLTHLIILVIVGYAVNAAFAWLFRVRTNPESTFITSLLLFFLFSPPAEGQNYLLPVVAAALASASKYVLAWRRRHIFNPAAVAAVICMIIGVGNVSWWVGSWQVLPGMIIAGGVIAYKTGQLRLATVYVAISWAVLGIRALSGENMSWPVVSAVLFVALFMLTDPLTQPPRNRERLIYTVGVALLAGIGLQAGQVMITPDAALLVGNIFAFLCGQRRGIFLELRGRTPLPDDKVRYMFRSGFRMSFSRGEYIELHVPHASADAKGTRRFYQIASRPADEKMEIIVSTRRPLSSFEKALSQLPIGSTVSATGIYDPPGGMRW
jgi:Na+-translocating ferredoxin:NAD+ oxidoreductase RnfD subunit